MSATVAGATSGALGEIRPAEARLHALARDVPGFGGYFVDSAGDVVAWVTDLQHEAAARSRVGQLVASGRIATPGSRVKIRKGDFDFTALADWRDLVSERILGVVPGVVLSDADEAANRVTIGIDEAAHPRVRGEVMRILAQLGVPAKAVRLVQAGAMSPDIAAPAIRPNQSLTDAPSPLVGGYSLSTNGFVCTFGPVVQHNGHAAVVINSHCTARTYSYDGSSVSNAYGESVGVEAFDPDPVCGTNCRRSDAALVYLNGWVASDFGRVARTTNTTWTWGTAGSLAVDQSNPTNDFIEIVQPYDVTVGMTIVKTGQSTGTTGGTVSNTCADLTGTDGFKRACSITSTYYSSSGDSGAPTYTYAYGTGALRLIGIHWGGDAQTQRTVSSYFTSVTSEIPGTYVATREAPLAVYINGPSDVSNSPACNLQYQAVATGGAGGFYFEWATDGMINSNNGDVVYAKFPGAPEGRYISVTVTDGNGSSQSAYLTVTSSAMYDMCY